jgi:dipeptidase E
MYRLDLLDPIRERVRAGLPYLGVSAGSNLACPPLPSRN